MTSSRVSPGFRVVAESRRDGFPGNHFRATILGQRSDPVVSCGHEIGRLAVLDDNTPPEFRILPVQGLGQIHAELSFDQGPLRVGHRQFPVPHPIVGKEEIRREIRMFRIALHHGFDPRQGGESHRHGFVAAACQLQQVHQSLFHDDQISAERQGVRSGSGSNRQEIDGLAVVFVGLSCSTQIGKHRPSLDIRDLGIGQAVAPDQPGEQVRR